MALGAKLSVGLTRFSVTRFRALARRRQNFKSVPKLPINSISKL